MLANYTPSYASHSSAPLLSICIPTYKRPALLKKALESLRPASEDIEIVVRDNSPGEENRPLVESILSTFNCEWRYDTNDLPAGMSNMDMMIRNFNICVEQARGKYIYILHDDDYLLPNGLSRILSNLKKYDGQYHLLMFGIDLVDANDQAFRHQYPKERAYLSPKKALQKLLDNSSFVRWPSIVIKREVFEQVGPYDASKHEMCDIDLWIRSFSEFGLFTVPEATTAYRIHEGAQTSKMFNAESIGTFLELFDLAASKQLLTPQEFAQCKARFFHQWILAGAYRSLKRGDFISANQVMELFKLPPIKKLSVPVKWLPHRLSFSAALLPFRTYSTIRSFLPLNQSTL